LSGACASLDLDLVGEPADHLAKGPCLVVVAAAGDQQIGCVPHGAQPAFRRSVQYGVVEIAEKCFDFAHAGKPRVATITAPTWPCLTMRREM